MQRFNHDSGTKTRQAPIHIGSCWNRIQSCDAYGESYDTNYHGGYYFIIMQFLNLHFVPCFTEVLPMGSSNY
ncbi:hypothetical protein glysoja_002386 [Glycine soja]|nr:hypothetical protein glysoja_002386 [Glycine soja]